MDILKQVRTVLAPVLLTARVVSHSSPSIRFGSQLSGLERREAQAHTKGVRDDRGGMTDYGSRNVVSTLPVS